MQIGKYIMGLEGGRKWWKEWTKREQRVWNEDASSNWTNWTIAGWQSISGKTWQVKSLGCDQHGLSDICHVHVVDMTAITQTCWQSTSWLSFLFFFSLSFFLLNAENDIGLFCSAILFCSSISFNPGATLAHMGSVSVQQIKVCPDYFLKSTTQLEALNEINSQKVTQNSSWIENQGD